MTALTLFVLFACGCLAMAFAPETHIGKAFRRLFVDGPVRVLNAGPLRALVVLVVFVVLLAIAVTAPEMVAIMGMTDLSLYLDLAVLSFILAAADGLKGAVLGAVAATKRYVDQRRLAPLRLGRPGQRARRVRKPRRPKPDNDGSLSGAWAIA